MDNKNSMQNAKIKRVFDFNFSTIMLFRCTKREFAQSFKDGKLYFNQPKNWIKEEMNGNKGVGDILEGTFMAIYKKNQSNTMVNEIKSGEVSLVDTGGLIHYRKKSIEDVYSLCFYGLNDNLFKEKIIDNEGKAHYTSSVKSEYFTDFSNKVTKDTYQTVGKLEQPVVLFINNPNKLFEKIKEALRKIGIKEKEVIISPIEYINKDEPYLLTVPYPKELLLKDAYYSEQKEIRIIINSENTAFKKYMNEHNNIIDIGNIEDIVEIYDYYFNDLVIEKVGKNEIMFNLPFPEYENFEDMELDSLLKILVQINNEEVAIEVEDYNKGKKELEEYIKSVIKEKYKIDIDYNDSGEVQIYDPNNLWSEYMKKYWNLSLYENKVDSIIEQGNYRIAYNEIVNISKNIDNSFPVDYYVAKIFDKNMEYHKAIERYSNCIDKEKKLKQSLAARAICYTKIKKDDLALEDWNKLQEIVGYNHEIYANKGINYIQLRKLDDAISEFDKSINMLEENSFAYYNRGVVYYMKRDYQKAKEDIQKALQYNPTNEFYQEQYERFYKGL